MCTRCGSWRWAPCLGTRDGRPNAAAVLCDISVSGARIRAATAFVTTGGVGLLAEIRQPLDAVERV